MSGQTGAKHPRPVPALTLTPAPEVNDHCVEMESFIITCNVEYHLKIYLHILIIDMCLCNII